MANDLAGIRDRVELYLMDVNNKSWDTATLDEALKQALSDLSGAAGAALAIKDLDAAAATTVENQDLATLIHGAAAYAASSRAVKRTEMVSIGEGIQITLKAWTTVAMEIFKDRLKTITQRKLHTSSTAPHSPMEWEEEPKNF
jgi:hypothetical protein